MAPAPRRHPGHGGDGVDKLATGVPGFPFGALVASALACHEGSPVRRSSVQAQRRPSSLTTGTWWLLLPIRLDRR